MIYRSEWNSTIFLVENNYSNSLLERFLSGSGKIAYTDIHQVALYFECTRPESDGTCKEVNQRMEVLQRVPEASGNLLLIFRDFIEDLCLDPNKLELVVQDGTICSSIRWYNNLWKIDAQSHQGGVSIIRYTMSGFLVSWIRRNDGWKRYYIETKFSSWSQYKEPSARSEFAV